MEAASAARAVVGAGAAARPRPRPHVSAAVAATTAALLLLAAYCGTADGAAIVAGGYCYRSHSAGPTSSSACAFAQPAPRATAASLASAGRSWAWPRHHLCASPAAASAASTTPSAMIRQRPAAARPLALAPLAVSTKPGAVDADADANAHAHADAGSLQGFLRKTVLLGIEPSPDVAAILVVYFVQGAIGKAKGTPLQNREGPSRSSILVINHTPSLAHHQASRAWPQRST